MEKITDTPFLDTMPTYPEIRIQKRQDDVYHNIQISTILRLPSSAGWQRVLMSEVYFQPKFAEEVEDYKEACFKKFTIAVFEYMFGMGGTNKIVYDDGTPMFPLDPDQRSEQERLMDAHNVWYATKSVVNIKPNSK